MLCAVIPLAACSRPCLRFQTAAHFEHVRVLDDSPEVQQLAARVAEEGKPHVLEGPEASQTDATVVGTPMDRILHRLEKAPGFDVKGGTGFDVQFQSDVFPLIKIRITEGPLRGKVGWIDRRLIDDPLTCWP